MRPIEAGGHEVVLLEGGREFFPALIEAIGQARDEVFVETYIFEDDASGRAVASALAAAAARGIAVHLAVDGFGTPRLEGEVGRTLREAGIRAEFYRPDSRRWFPTRQRLRRLHRKIAVVDGRTAFVGGINMLDDHYDPNHGALVAPRLDFAVRIRGPIVAKVHLAAYRLWWELSVLNQPLRALRDADANWRTLAQNLVSDVTRAGSVRATLVLRDNLRFRRAIERRYLRLIGRARREVLIANAYFFPGARFRRALVAAARRGVRVRLLLQGRVEYRLPYFAARSLYDELLNEGIEISEYTRSFLHAKVAVIDDAATVGSSNIDPFSLLLAREANVFVNNPAFAARLRERIEAAIGEGSVPVAQQSHRRRAWPIRLLNAIAFVVLRLGVAISGEGGDY
ncbi:MAG: cardiolipin synthase ClsB [Burkholderiaceae bacterium]|nr:cardiolipin synthase ClsB [Burkholderiaceae bacterium]